MDELIAHASDVLPLDVRVSALSLSGYLLRRFTNDFQLSDGRILNHLISHEPILVNCGGILLNPHNGIQDMTEISGIILLQPKITSISPLIRSIRYLSLIHISEPTR